MRWGLRRMRVEDGGGKVWEKVKCGGSGRRGKTGGGGRWTERGQQAQHRSERKRCVFAQVCVCVSP